MPWSPLVIMEGHHIDHFDNLIAAMYIDLRHPSARHPIPMITKGCRPEHAIENGSDVKISTPRTFRHQGENLILDPGEGYFHESETVQEAIDEPGYVEEVSRHEQARIRAAELVGFDWNTQTISTHKTVTRTRSFEYGPKGWLFCAAIPPSTPDEWDTWWGTLEDGYCHASPIHRPREFARALGSMVAEQLGPQGLMFPLSSALKDWPSFQTEHPAQMVFHGPVVYVDDVDDWLHSATTEQDYFMRAVFTKNQSHHAQREYRFVIWSEKTPADDTQLLQASPALLDAMIAHANDPCPPMMPSIVQPADESPWNIGAASNQPDSEKTASNLEGNIRGPANQSESVVRPHRLESASLPDDFLVRTATYAGVEALRKKISDIHLLEGESAERRNAVTAAAWFAEQDIRTLCGAFDDPIRGISISPDGFIVVHVALHERPNLECNLAVGPSGEANVMMDTGQRTKFVASLGQFHRANIGQIIWEFVECRDPLPEQT